MLGTRERNDIDLRQERTNEYAPLRNNEYNPEYSFRGYSTSNDYRDSSEIRYAQKYENIDFYNSQYDCAANENVFRPIELSDITQDVKPQKAKKQKGKYSMSVKAKVLVGVYTALVVLIVALLLVNAIPAVNAQTTTTTEPPAQEIINDENATKTRDELQSASGLVKGDGYVYETKSNWFEDFCHSLSNIFK